LGEIRAEKLNSPKCNKPKFEKAVREFLIPPEYEGELEKLKYETDVIGFAERIGIHRAIYYCRSTATPSSNRFVLDE
jgi:hypothetical protein